MVFQFALLDQMLDVILPKIVIPMQNVCIKVDPIGEIEKCPKNVELIHVKYWPVLMDRVVQFHEMFVLKKYLN